MAGALGLAGIAATLAIDAIAPAAGESVLICGATGGAIAIQLAKNCAHVIAATRRYSNGCPCWITR